MTLGKLESEGWHWRPLYPRATFFANIYFSSSHQLYYWSVWEEPFGSLFRVIWNYVFSQSWLSLCRKLRECLPCQRHKPDALRRLYLIRIYCLTVCTGQQGKKQREMSWSHASTPGFWHPSAAGAWGLFSIPPLWSWQQVTHSVIYLRAAETLCALSPPFEELAWPCLAPCLEWGSFNPLVSPNGSSRLGQT